jgi:hypothetical protein
VVQADYVLALGSQLGVDIAHLTGSPKILLLRYRDDANQDTVSLRARPITLILYNHSDDG